MNKKPKTTPENAVTVGFSIPVEFLAEANGFSFGTSFAFPTVVDLGGHSKSQNSYAGNVASYRVNIIGEKEARESARLLIRKNSKVFKTLA